VSTDYESKFIVTGETSGAEAAAAKLTDAWKKVQSGAARARDSVLSYTRGLMSSTAAQLGLGLGLGAIVRASYEANKEMGMMRKHITGILVANQNWKAGVSPIMQVTASMRDAKAVTEDLEEAEERLAIPSTELGDAFHQLGGTLMGRYGSSLKQATQMSISAAAASRVLGMDVGSVSASITRLLEARQLSARAVDPFSNFMRRALGDTKALKAMSPEKLLERISRELRTMDPAAEKMSQTMGGTMFRIQDFLEDTLRDIGGPTFKYIGDQLERWRKLLMASVGDGKTLADVYSQKVLAAVKKIVEVVEYLAGHWKEIAVVIGALEMTKVISGTMAWIGTLKEALTTLRTITALSGAGGLAKGAGGAFAGRALAAAGPLGIAAAGVVGGFMINKGINEQREQSQGLLRGQESTEAFKSLFWAMRGRDVGESADSRSARKDRAQQMLQHLSSLGMIDAQGNLIGGQGGLGYHMGYAAEDKDLQTKLAQAVGLKLPQESLGKVGAGAIVETFGDQFRKLKGDFPELWDALGGKKDTVPDTSTLTKPAKIQATFTGPINIKQEFKEADPDNVFVRFKEDLEREATSRTQSEIMDPFGA